MSLDLAVGFNGSVSSKNSRKLTKFEFEFWTGSELELFGNRMREEFLIANGVSAIFDGLRSLNL